MIHSIFGNSDSDFHTTSDNGYDKGGKGLRLIKEIFAVAVLILLMTAIFAKSSEAFSTHSYMNLRIRLDKKNLQCNEPVDGKIILRNHIPASYPATFIIKIYKNNKLVRLLLTNVARVPPGETEFDLNSFGIECPETGEDPLGSWHIIILKHGEKSIYDHAEFHVKSE